MSKKKKEKENFKLLSFNLIEHRIFIQLTGKIFIKMINLNTLNFRADALRKN